MSGRLVNTFEFVFYTFAIWCLLICLSKMHSHTHIHKQRNFQPTDRPIERNAIREKQKRVKKTNVDSKHNRNKTNRNLSVYCFFLNLFSFFALFLLLLLLFLWRLFSFMHSSLSKINFLFHLILFCTFEMKWAEYWRCKLRCLLIVFNSVTLFCVYIYFFYYFRFTLLSFGIFIHTPWKMYNIELLLHFFCKVLIWIECKMYLVSFVLFCSFCFIFVTKIRH